MHILIASFTDDDLIIIFGFRNIFHTKFDIFCLGTFQFYKVFLNIFSLVKFP